MASVSFAQRLYQFPLGVFGIAVATAIFPALARLAEDRDAFVDVLRRGLRLVVFVGLPATAGLILVRGPLTTAIYQGGHFTAADAGRVQFILIGYASAVWAYSMIHVLTRAYYARGETAVPVKVAVSMVGLNLALNCTLIWTPLREAGLAWSTAICAVIQVCLLAVLLRRRVERVVDRSVRKSWVGSAVITALMGGGVWLVSTFFGPAATWWAALLELAVLVGAGGAIVAIAALAFRMPELRWLMGGRGTEARRHEGTK
jgi:putative peptidoglycan lipid II flippase